MDSINYSMKVFLFMLYGANHNKVYQNCDKRHHFFTILDTPLNYDLVFILNFTWVYSQDLAQF